MVMKLIIAVLIITHLSLCGAITYAMEDRSLQGRNSYKLTIPLLVKASPFAPNG